LLLDTSLDGTAYILGEHTVNCIHKLITSFLVCYVWSMQHETSVERLCQGGEKSFASVTIAQW